MSINNFQLTQPVSDLGQYSDNLTGLYSPIYDEDTVSRFLQTQFLEDAETYIRKYQNTEIWGKVVRGGLEGLGYAPEAPLKILDIGSGSGNTVFPLLDVFRNATMIATDLSIPLLAALKGYIDADEKYAKRDVVIMQLNAEEMIFEANQFDLIIGGAILHHLFDPTKTLEQCYNVLKPGCHAIFVEPFEIGNQVLTLGMKQVMEINKLISDEEDKLDPAVINAFGGICHDLDRRKGRDKSDPIFTQLDDKWMFTTKYFEEASDRIGFQSVTCRTFHQLDQMFSKQANLFLRLILDRTDIQYPEWASRVFQTLDEHFSKDLREDLIIEGHIILQK